MTNLSAAVPAWQRRFTRERVLVGTPVLAAVVLFSGLIVLDGFPRLGRLQEQHERLEELRLKQASVPGLRRALAQQEVRAQEVAQQQALLVDLIAGRDRIQTFMAEVGRVADATGVVINLYQPAAPPAAAPPSKSRPRKRSSRSKQEAPPKDPLKELGYVKTSVELKAMGPYEPLQVFLRRMESLQLLVQPSGLTLNSVVERSNAKDSDKSPAKPLTELKLRLSFFDRVVGPRAKALARQPRP